MQMWRDLSIKYKLVFGMGILALLALLVTLRLSSALKLVERHYRDMLDGPAMLANQSEEASKRLLQCRRFEKDFLVDFDEQYLAEHQKTYQGLQDTLSAMADTMQGMENAELRNLDLEGATRDAAVYHQAFQEMVAVWKEKGLSYELGARGEMRSVILGVEDVFKRINEDSFKVQLLMLRRYEKDYIIRGLAKYPESWATTLAKLRGELGSYSLTSTARKQVEESLQSYETSFTKLQAINQQIAIHVHEMQAAFSKVEPILDGVVEKATALTLVNRQQVVELVDKTNRSLALIYGLVGFAFLGFAVLITRGIVSPITKITASVKAVEAGDLTAIPDNQGNDEIGKLAQAFGTMTRCVAEAFGTESVDWSQLALEKINERGKVDEERERSLLLEDQVIKMQAIMEAVSAGDFSMEVAFTSGNGMGRIGKCLADLLRILRMDLSHISGQANVIGSTAETLGGISDEISRQSDHNHEHIRVTNIMVDTVNVNLQCVATAVEQMNACISEIAKNTDFAEGVAKNAVTEANHSAQVIAELELHGNEISAMADQIGKVAEQTNLLSLNASIEAERAGVSGKGFRVVASEVKELARTTGQTTQNIRHNVNCIRKAMVEAVTSVQKIKGTIDQIFDVQRSIASAVEEQSVTTGEIQELITQTTVESSRIQKQMDDVEANANSTKGSANKATAEVVRLTQLSTTLHKTLAKFTLT